MDSEAGKRPRLSLAQFHQSSNLKVEWNAEVAGLASQFNGLEKLNSKQWS